MHPPEVIIPQESSMLHCPQIGEKRHAYVTLKNSHKSDSHKENDCLITQSLKTFLSVKGGRTKNSYIIE
jgi:hypothetical protein